MKEPCGDYELFRLKELAYKIAETKNDYYSWSQYIEVCDSIDIKDARERLNAFIH